jgi:hypothetical protein
LDNPWFLVAIAVVGLGLYVWSVRFLGWNGLQLMDRKNESGAATPPD